jgi:ribulose-bisphosphate carboxylase large chain
MQKQREEDNGWLTVHASHPYINRKEIASAEEREAAMRSLNADRGACAGEAVLAAYCFMTATNGPRLSGLIEASRMALEHGTLKPWHAEAGEGIEKPLGYDGNMSWVSDIQLLAHDENRGFEAGLVTIAYPLAFFDKRDDMVPLAQLFEAVASEPVSAFIGLHAAKLVDLQYPESLRKRFPGQRWSNRRVRAYLGLAGDEPLIGTIVKPKTGLTPELFARAVVEAAEAGARFTKADENMHLSLQDIPRYVGAVSKALRAAGFDLSDSVEPTGKRFLFAPHITTDPDRIRDYAAAAVEAGANALMFTPYYAGGHTMLARIAREFDVPVYAHTAGMNILTGSPNWGIDSRVFYVLSGLCGAAFMQLPTTGGYIRPFDVEKPAILEALAREGLDGVDGMTLAIAGGLGPENIAKNVAAYGSAGRMFLAGTSVYAHPKGPKAGVHALIQAYRETRNH